MDEQDMDEPELQTLDLLNRFIEMTTVRLVHWIDRLQDLVARGDCTIEAIRVIVIVEIALSRLIEERRLLAPAEPSV